MEKMSGKHNSFLTGEMGQYLLTPANMYTEEEAKIKSGQGSYIVLSYSFFKVI
jgi:hypothetical protein